MSDKKEVVEKITIDGDVLEFVTREGKTFLKKSYALTDSKKNDPESIEPPNLIVVTRENGLILFVLRAPEEDFKFVTVRTLNYKYQYQWFEPLADNYRELVYLNNRDYNQDAYKHFTWKQIDEFASVDRSPMDFRTEKSGDWKQSKEGGSGFFLVMIEGEPYWADAVGQIPFAVDTYRLLQSVPGVVKVGIEWGPGEVMARIKGDFDKSNKYDNYFVLRGALYAQKKYSYSTIPNSSGTYPAVRVVESVNKVSPNELATPITASEASKYASWNR
ncbi:MAG: hypothetical protein ACRCWH_10425 [Aeromonas veronii]